MEEIDNALDEFDQFSETSDSESESESEDPEETLANDENEPYSDSDIE